MTAFEDEVETNRLKFNADWQAEIQKNWAALSANPVFPESYRKIAALNAIRAHLIEPRLEKESAAFFLEAQNDALVSHVDASFGAWRSALQALRSCIENSLCALYYKDHPIELQQWMAGDFRIGFSELVSYFRRHPTLTGINPNLTGLEILDKEYSTLSLAVHGSAKSFRMTNKSSEVLLWNTDAANAGMWSARLGLTVQGICLLMVSFFHDDLEGMKLTALREVLFYALSEAKRDLLKSELKIAITKPA